MGLIDILEKNKNARKLFGKREIIIIKKQILGVKLTQSEKNRLSRDIRKKFEIIEELSPYKEDFNLKKGLETKRVVEEVLEVIKKTELYPKIKRIVLFGSKAVNEATLLSDIDIAVEFDSIDKETAFKFCLKVGSEFINKVDIQVYNVLPEKIKKQINEYGRVLYKRGE